MSARHDAQVTALDARWSRTTGLLLVVAGVACALSAVTAGEPILYPLAALAEVTGLRLCFAAERT